MATSSLNPCKDCGYNLGATFEEVSNLNPREPRCPECGSIVKELISQHRNRRNNDPLVPPGEFGSGADRISFNGSFYCDNYTNVDLPEGYLVSDIASYHVGTSEINIYYTDGTYSTHEASATEGYDSTTQRIYTTDGDEVHEQSC